MIAYRKKNSNLIYSSKHIEKEINEMLNECVKDGNLFEEYLGTEFSLTSLFENPLTEEQQNQVKEDFRDWCYGLAEDSILSKYEIVEILGED
jgi:hypothetical protein